MTKWTEKWPTEPGWYWFWGRGSGDALPSLYPVKVHEPGGIVNVPDGPFMYESQSEGMWCPAAVPELPELPTM